MKKLLFRFILLLNILLLGGYGTSYAAVKSNLNSNPEFKAILEGYSHNYHNDLHNAALHVKSDAPVTVKANDKTELRDTENEDDEVQSFKKFSVVTLSHTAFFYTQIPGYYFSSREERLPVSNRITHFSSFGNLFIVFRVIRI